MSWNMLASENQKADKDNTAGEICNKVPHLLLAYISFGEILYSYF